MSLKFKLDSLDGLDDATKALYEKQGDKFVLKVEGLEEGDTAGLKNKVEQLLTETATLKKNLKDKEAAEAGVREEARKAAEEAAAKKGDIEALRKSADDRVAAAKAEVEGQYKPQVEKLNSTVRRLLVDNVAQASAGRIAIKGSESVLLPHIVSRLDVEDRNGELVTVIKGADGKASAMSVADLEKELSGNAAFAPLIVGSKGSGGGAGGSKPSGGGASGGKSIKRAEFDALSPVARMEHMSTGGVVAD